MNKFILSMLLCCGSAFAQMTVISDTLTNPDSSGFNGTLHISWSRDFQFGAQTVRAGAIDTLVMGGVLNISLWPSDRVPGGLVYSVSGTYNNGNAFIDFWSVPYSRSSVTLSNIRLATTGSGAGLSGGTTNQFAYYTNSSTIAPATFLTHGKASVASGNNVESPVLMQSGGCGLYAGTGGSGPFTDALNFDCTGSTVGKIHRFQLIDAVGQMAQFVSQDDGTGWSVTGLSGVSGGASSFSQLTDFATTVSGSLLQSACSPYCTARVGSTAYYWNTPTTASATGTGRVYEYIDANGARCWGSTLPLTVTNSTYVPGITSFPDGSIPLYFWDFTLSVPASTGSDRRAALSTMALYKQGNNITIAPDFTISATGGGTVTGDVTGTAPGALTVAGLNGKLWCVGFAPTDGQTLTYNNASSCWQASTPAAGGSLPLIALTPFFYNPTTGGVTSNMQFSASAQAYGSLSWVIGSGYSAASTDTSVAYIPVYFPAGYANSPAVTLNWLIGNSAGLTNVQIAFGAACDTTVMDPTLMTFTSVNSNIVAQTNTTVPQTPLTATIPMPGGGCAGKDGWLKIGPRNNALGGSTGYIVVTKVRAQL